MSDTESDRGYEPDSSLRRLKSILYERRPAPPAAALARLGESNARRVTDAFEEDLVVDMPKALQEMSLGDVGQAPLDIRGHESLLTEQAEIAIEERRREIANSQKQLDRALHELAAVKRKEEELLVRRVAELEKEFANRLRDLQRGFSAQAEELKREVVGALAQQRRQCELAVETKARALSTGLAASSRPSRSPSPSPREGGPRPGQITRARDAAPGRGWGNNRPETERLGGGRGGPGGERSTAGTPWIGRRLSASFSKGGEEAGGAEGAWGSGCATPTSRARRWRRPGGGAGRRREEERGGPARSRRRDLLRLIDSDEEEW